MKRFILFSYMLFNFNKYYNEFIQKLEEAAIKVSEINRLLNK